MSVPKSHAIKTHEYVSRLPGVGLVHRSVCFNKLGRAIKETQGLEVFGPVLAQLCTHPAKITPSLQHECEYEL
jgi:hypothetical protein